MKLTTLDKIFKIKYGNQFDLNKLESTEDSSISFVSRSSQNLGVVCKVEPYKNAKPYPAGLITVTLGGTYLLSSFVQQEPFYTAQNIKVLEPKVEMTFEEKLYYCKIIEKNRFRYSSHGREANKTLDTLLVPETIPIKFDSLSFTSFIENNVECFQPSDLKLNINEWAKHSLNDLFFISASSDLLIDDLSIGGKTPYISSTEKNNGVFEFVHDEATNNGNTITANRGGSVGFFFYQPSSYLATPVDVRILTPKFKLNKYIGIFLVTVLKLEKFKFNYSRKMGSDRLSKLSIKLPTKDGSPDFDFMENYIKSLPYSLSV